MRKAGIAIIGCALAGLGWASLKVFPDHSVAAQVQAQASSSATLTENRMVGGTVAITAGQGLVSTTVNCPVAMSCVTVAPTGSRILGISISGGAVGATIPIMDKGFVVAGFTNQPVWNQTAVVDAGGYFVNVPQQVTGVSSALGIGGKVSMVTNPDGSAITCPSSITAPYCAQISFPGPGQVGGMTDLTNTIGTLPLSAGGTGSTSASGALANLGGVTASQAAAAAPVSSVNGQTGAVTVTVPTTTSQLTNNSGYITAAQAPVTSVNGSTGAVTVAVPVTSVNAKTGAVVLGATDVGADATGAATAAQTAAQTYASNASNLSSGTVSASRLPTLSTTVNGQTCTLGGTCTVNASPTLVGTCTVTQTAAVSITAGPRTVSATCSGVVSGGYYLAIETASSLTAYPGYGIFAGATGTAANTLQVTLYAPLLAIGASYNISVVVYKVG